MVVGRLAGGAVSEGGLPHRLWRLGADLSIWQALYATGLVAMFTQSLGEGLLPGLAPAMASLFGAHAMFLLDRVKLSNALLDPADAAADPRRDALFRRHGPTLRLLAIASLGAGMTIGGVWVSWITAVSIGAGVLGVLVYAGRPGKRASALRVKSIPVLKNLYVGAGLTAVALACVLPGTDIPWDRAGLVALASLLLVTADAVLCDLDDTEADRSFGVGSIAAEYGGSPAGAVAIALTAGASVCLLSTAHHTSAAARTTWAILLPATTVAILFAGFRRVKSLVDVRLVVLAAACAAMLSR